jgi:hypothetical protein
MKELHLPILIVQDIGMYIIVLFWEKVIMKQLGNILLIFLILVGCGSPKWASINSYPT